MGRKYDPEPVCCSVCKRAAVGLGYLPDRRGANGVAWLCDDPDCLSLGKAVYHMPSKPLNQFEVFSLADAGDEAGTFLEKIGKTDLAQLSQEEWSAFLKIILTTFEQKMRERLLGHHAPF